MSKNISRIALVLAMLVVIPSAILAQKQKLQAVDLGLSVKWANMNVGALSPFEYGNYYAWGEIAEKRFYYYLIESTHIKIDITGSGDPANSSASFNILKYSHEDALVQLQSADDAAFQNCGSTWHIPTQAQMAELVKQCDWTPSIQNGTKGYIVKSKLNGNSIFLPFSGYKTGHGTKGSQREYCTTQGYYWTSTLAESKDKMDATVLKIQKTEAKGDEGYYGMMPLHRTTGCVIRPVTK